MLAVRSVITVMKKKKKKKKIGSDSLSAWV